MGADNPFTGWSYRSLLYDPDLTRVVGAARLVGLRLACADALPGEGIVPGSDWVYDYIGWLVPVWPPSDAFKQRTAMVGWVSCTIALDRQSGRIDLCRWAG